MLLVLLIKIEYGTELLQIFLKSSKMNHSLRNGLQKIMSEFINSNSPSKSTSAGVSLELSHREKFCNIFRISVRSFGATF